MNKALDAKERKAVASLSSRADPTSRSVSFTYHVDGYDIPGGWQALMEKYAHTRAPSNIRWLGAGGWWVEPVHEFNPAMDFQRLSGKK
ncbi:MAG: hypothetical protein ACYCV0_07470 [Desulfitobacteriaceae bacterium]